MWRLVLDTNVVLDLFHWGNHDVAPLMTALRAGAIRCVANDATLDELARVLTYPQLKLTPDMQRERYACYRELVDWQPAVDAPPLPRCRDRDDQKFIELASTASADLLVSRDKLLLKLSGRTRLPYRIVKPADAVQAISQPRA